MCAGLPADAHSSSGRRGRLALDQLTRAEQQALEHAEAIARAHAAGYAEGRIDGGKDALARMLENPEIRAAVERVLGSSR